VSGVGTQGVFCKQWPNGGTRNTLPAAGMKWDGSWLAVTGGASGAGGGQGVRWAWGGRRTLETVRGDWDFGMAHCHSTWDGIRVQGSGLRHEVARGSGAQPRLKVWEGISGRTSQGWSRRARGRPGVERGGC